MARPKSDKYDTKRIIRKLKKYVEETQLPILKEFCFNNNLNYKYFLQLCAKDIELDNARCHLLDKKEIQLEKALMTGANNTAFIFQLKQLGWRDNPEPVVINNNIQNNVENEDKLKSCSAETLEELDEVLNQVEVETKNAKKVNDN